MSNIMIYQLNLECNKCHKYYFLKVPVEEEPELYKPFEDWKCEECKTGKLIVTYMERRE